MSHRIATAKTAIPQTRRTGQASPTRLGTAATASATIVATTAAAPAATVMGTMNRRQWTNAAIVAVAPTAAAAIVPACAGRSLGANTSAPTPAATPPTKVSSRTMLGNAIRRRAVKYSASAHDVAATSRPLSGDAIRAPICPTAISNSPIAMVTKMSLNPVSSRNCSSSTAGAAWLLATNARSACAASGDSAPAVTAPSISLSLYIRFPPVPGRC